MSVHSFLIISIRQQHGVPISYGLLYLGIPNGALLVCDLREVVGLPLSASLLCLVIVLTTKIATITLNGVYIVLIISIYYRYLGTTQ